MKKVSCLAIFILALTFISPIRAQLSSPDGDSIISVVHLQIGTVSAHAGLMARGWYIARDNHTPDVMHMPISVPSAMLPRKGYADQFVLLWSSGLYKFMQVSDVGGVLKATEIQTDSIAVTGLYTLGFYNFIAAKNVYTIMQGQRYSYLAVKYSDSLAWTLDTTGLPLRSYIRSYDVDTMGTLYVCIGDSGIYKQSAGAVSFNKVNTINSRYPSMISINKYNHILFQAEYSYFSYDNAATWDTALAYPPFGAIHEDLYGNLYSYSGNILGTSNSRIFRSMDTAVSWAQIGLDILNRAVDTAQGLSINNITGDSTLYASTSWGTFISRDHGDSWNIQIDSVGSAPDGYWHFDNGRQVAATHLGIFVKDPSSLVWRKTFPPDSISYLKMGVIQGDTAGNIYTMMMNNKIGTPMKSDDQGYTWLPDTLGFADILGVSPHVYYKSYSITEQGTSLIAASTNTGLQIFKKTSGGGFLSDTIGLYNLDFLARTEDIYGFASDHSGRYYMTVARGLAAPPHFIWHQPASGGRWTYDSLPSSSGLFGQEDMPVMRYDHHGGLIGCNSSIYQNFQGGTWTALPMPSASVLPSTYGVASVGGDASDAIFAGFYPGVGCTHDLGVTWDRVPGLDSTVVKNFQTFGDTTYVLATTGLYKMTCNGAVIIPNSIHGVADINSIFKLYPNPASSECTIISDPVLGRDSYIEIQDLTGRIVGKLQLTDATNSFRTDGMSDGMYICTAIREGVAVSSQKLIVAK